MKKYCKDCVHLETEGAHTVCGKAYKGIVMPYDSCEKCLTKEDSEEKLMDDLRREMIANNRREIDRRLRLYVQAQIAYQFRPCRANADKSKLALNDFWAYVMPILEG